MKLKDYIEKLNEALLEDQSIGELEVYSPTDGEWNSILKQDIGLDIAYVPINSRNETDEFVMECYLADVLEEYVDYDEFMIENKKVIIL